MNKPHTTQYQLSTLHGKKPFEKIGGRKYWLPAFYPLPTMFSALLKKDKSNVWINSLPHNPDF